MDKTSSDVLIVGAGAAGHSAAVTLRRSGFDGSIRIVHAEPFAPYNRTLVTKGILRGLLTPEQSALPALDSIDVETIPGSAVGMEERGILLHNGRRLIFAPAVVATGAAPRPLQATGVSEGVFTLHSASDALRIRGHAGPTFERRVVTVLGAGLVGAEAASYLVSAGARVHLVARSEIPLAHSLGLPIATRLRDLHAAHTEFHPGRTVRSISASGSGGDVLLDDGTSVSSDVIVLAHGTVPAVSWIRSDGAAIEVDDRLRARTIPAVYAAGGVAAHVGPDGSLYRMDHWDDAVAQGAHAARALLHDLHGGDDPGPYRHVSGFTVNVHGVTLSGAGVVLPQATAETTSSAGGGLVSTFRTADGKRAGAVGWSAAREILAVKHELAGGF